MGQRETKARKKQKREYTQLHRGQYLHTPILSWPTKPRKHFTPEKGRGGMHSYNLLLAFLFGLVILNTPITTTEITCFRDNQPHYLHTHVNVYQMTEPFEYPISSLWL